MRMIIWICINCLFFRPNEWWENDMGDDKFETENEMQKTATNRLRTKGLNGLEPLETVTKELNSLELCKWVVGEGVDGSAHWVGQTGL